APISQTLLFVALVLRTSRSSVSAAVTSRVLRRSPRSGLPRTRFVAGQEAETPCFLADYVRSMIRQRTRVFHFTTESERQTMRPSMTSRLSIEKSLLTWTLGGDGLLEHLSLFGCRFIAWLLPIRPANK